MPEEHRFLRVFDQNPDDKALMITVAEVMTHEVVCITMDTALGAAMDVCADKRIRHLPVVDDQKILAGLVTDRDLRYFISPRIGTISENNSDRGSLRRPVHLIMAREIVATSPEACLSEAAQAMLTNRVGCLPVLDPERHVIGIITTTDLIRYIAQKRA